MKGLMKYRWICPGLGVIAEPTDGDDVIIDTSQLRADIREALVITQDGGKLEMETDSHRGFGRNASDPGMLYISLPQGAYYNSFSADVGAGFLEMRGISAGEISLDGGSRADHCGRLLCRRAGSGLRGRTDHTAGRGCGKCRP